MRMSPRLPFFPCILLLLLLGCCPTAAIQVSEYMLTDSQGGAVSLASGPLSSVPGHSARQSRRLLDGDTLQLAFKAFGCAFQYRLQRHTSVLSPDAQITVVSERGTVSIQAPETEVSSVDC